MLRAFDLKTMGTDPTRGIFRKESKRGTRLSTVATFGDYVKCTVPCTDNSMSSRTDDGVVMLPTGNRTGSVKTLSLATGALITRDNFSILPMPLSVIATLIAMALLSVEL